MAEEIVCVWCFKISKNQQEFDVHDETCLKVQSPEWIELFNEYIRNVWNDSVPALVGTLVANSLQDMPKNMKLCYHRLLFHKPTTNNSTNASDFHIVKIENGHKLYECRYVGCNKTLTSPFGIRSHYRIHHLNDPIRKKNN